MIRPRLTVCLLLQDGGLVKTVRFSDPKYVGDPLNAVRIFNEKEVDELIVLDINATKESREPNFRLIEQLASECNMPLCYGGGISRTDEVQRLISLGVEKVALGAAAIETPEIISEASRIVGQQSVVVVIDVAAAGILKRPTVFVRNGSKKVGASPTEVAINAQNYGAGEILINSIDRDGSMVGYDLELAKKVKSSVQVPVTCLGGAGDLGHIKSLHHAVGLIGAAAGSLFVFKGKYRAVLINYPNAIEKRELFADFSND